MSIYTVEAESEMQCGVRLDLPEIFLAAPSGAGYPGNVLFATVQKSTGTPPLVKVAYSAVSIPLNGGTPPAPIANSVYAPLAIIAAGLTDTVWQVTGITDANGGWWGHSQYGECKHSVSYAFHHHGRRKLCVPGWICGKSVCDLEQ